MSDGWPTERHEGGCLCGRVRYEVRGKLRGVVSCHCRMCQKLHGAVGAHTKALRRDFFISNPNGLAWYKSSDIARRGFCQHCGSSLFWDGFDFDSIGILAGSLDQTANLETIGHIFVGERATFDDIADQKPQFEGSSEGNLPDDYR